MTMIHRQEEQDAIREEAERKLAGYNPKPTAAPLLTLSEAVERIRLQQERIDARRRLVNDADLASYNRVLLTSDEEVVVPSLDVSPGNVLDPSDPFDAVLVDILSTNRRKRKDYVSDGESPFENFIRSADQVGVEPGAVVEVLIATKQARLRALLSNGRLPGNESIEDSLLDRAVYSIIALALYRALDG